MKLYFQLHEIEHAQKARQLERKLSKKPGLEHVHVSTAGGVQLDLDPEQIDRAEVMAIIQQMGFKIKSTKHDHDHEPEGSGGHHHVPSSLLFLGENTELYFSIASGVFWLTGLLLPMVVELAPIVPIVLLIIGIFFGGFFTFITAGRDLLNGKFEIDFLMLVAAIGAAALGKWSEAALLLFLFSLGHALEHYAMKRSRKSIAALSDLAPDTALVRRGDQLVDLPIDDLQVGDIVVVKPNARISADGVVLEGDSSVNQAPITGESVPVDKRPHPDAMSVSDMDSLDSEHRVFAGTINGSGVVEVRVLRLTQDSTLSRLIHLVREAESQKSPTQHLTDKFEKYYVPVVLIVVVLLIFAYVVIDETFEQSFYRAMSVLIAASPCALAISTPSAVLAGIARAAQRGVLVKGGKPLEDLGDIQAIAFDKTGTLTRGRPSLTDVIPYGEVEREHLLRVAMAVESLSDHPLAQAIVDGASQELGETTLPVAENIQALTARGVKADWQGKAVHIGNRRLFEELTGQPVPKPIDQTMTELETSGHTAMIVHEGGHYLGVIGVMDVARPESRSTIEQLKQMGIQRMIMLTGDNQKVADAIAADIGITDPLGSLLPEDKVRSIELLTHEIGKVAMVGDGVNDAPAMARSAVGIAMGAAGSQVALETADVALMADRLDNLPFAIGLSRKSRRIIKQNLVVSLGVVAILVPLTITGSITIPPAVVGHEGSTVLVVLNALRLLRYEHRSAN